MPCKDRHTGRECHVKTEAEVGAIRYKPKDPKDYLETKITKAGFHCSFQSEYRPAKTLISGLWLPGQ
jgi:hypothetical protein